MAGAIGVLLSSAVAQDQRSSQYSPRLENIHKRLETTSAGLAEAVCSRDKLGLRTP